MTEDFDIGPLTWVKDEIDQALKSVLENFEAVAKSEDISELRFSQAHLYQVSGALDMVGLQGCKRYCSEIEKLASKLEKKTVASSAEALESLRQAVDELSTYLQALLDGGQDMPLRLFPTMQKMATLQGETVEESELFFPDTSLRAPKDIPSNDLDEAAMPAYVAEQRQTFQKSLVNWLKSSSAESLETMRSAIDNVQQVQQQPAQKTLWWAAGAFTDTLAQKIIAENAAVKRLCRRLDQQLRSLSEGATRATGNLLRDVLYYVALSAPENDRIARVKAIFELDQLLPGADGSADASRVETTAGRQQQDVVGDKEENPDTDALLAVAQQIKDALSIAEQALDTYFRNTSDRQVLETAEKPLLQIVAAFDMLDMATPTAMARACSAFVEYFRSEAHVSKQESSQDQFELVAESLSMLGFYVEELPHVRPLSIKALEGSLARLDAELAKAGLSVASPKKPASRKKAVPVGEASSEVPSEAPAKVEDKKVTDSSLDAEMLDIYLTEAEEVLANIAQNLQALRVNATDREPLVEVRRGFHTLKGSGRMVGLNALGEVAWSVEKLLNHVMESKVIPSPAQLTFVEKASAAFAGWAAQLREANSVELSYEQWQREAAELENESAKQKPAAEAEEVLIGGTRKISRTLFNIFLGEAKQHLKVLNDELALLSVNHPEKPTAAIISSAHTLASNAGATGFKSIETLARTLEHWLDAYDGQWTEQTLTLLSNVVATLVDMMAKVGELNEPKPVSRLLAALKEATELAGSDENDNVVIEIEPPGAEPEVSEQAELEAELLAAPVIQIEAPEQEPQFELEPAPVIEPVPAEAKRSETAESNVVDQELLTIFVEEARELVPQVGNELRAWRVNPAENDHPDALQRVLHTLKGSARMAGQSALGDTVHGMEDRIIQALKGKVSAVDFDDMFIDLDRIGALLEEAVGASTTGRTGSAPGAEEVASPGRSADRRAQYLRLRADVLDRLINEAGEISIARSRMDREMQGFKQFSLDLTESVHRLRGHLRELEIETESQLQSRMTLLQEAQETFDPLEFDRFTRLQELTRMMAESVNDVATIQHGLLVNLDETQAALQQQNRMNRELQHGLMDVRMVPFSLISERLHRIVRQTARDLDKRVDMHIEGDTVELDRSVLDKIGAPLEHLLRNAVGHGLETTAQRKKAGKSEVGNITLKVIQENDEIVLTVVDDGAGINLDKVREKAVQNGLFTADQVVSPDILLSVIFEPGFSTATSITQIAGRGVGLDAVRTDIAALGGRIDVSNTEDRGAIFTIYLPVTLSVAQVVLIRAGSRIFAVPSIMVEQVQKLKPAPLAEAREASNVSWAGRDYPLHFLAKLIGEADQEPEEQNYTPLLLLRSGTHHIAMHVDEILGNQEIVMKAIGSQLARVPGIIGATVMGDGSIVLIVNPVQLANREFLAVSNVKAAAIVAPEIKTVPTVMVVDDSLTMRKVLGRTLEREGYIVVTAKDGMDALQKLQETVPDIMLLDIEMPRMDGFELARNVRGDALTANIPIIIISSRTAEKHRNIAKELGVNAFLGKPVQDEELITNINELLGQTASPIAG